MYQPPGYSYIVYVQFSLDFEEKKLYIQAQFIQWAKLYPKQFIILLVIFDF